MNYSFKKILSLWIILVSLFQLVACKDSKKEDELAKNLSKLDEEAGNYKPQTTGIDSQSSHIAVKIIYDKGNWIADSTYSELRPGRLPYLQKGSGTFEVIYTDNAGKEIGRYKFSDPTLRRVCEGEKPGFSKVETTVIEILLPGNQSIGRFELKQEGKTIAAFKVPPVRRNNNDNTSPGSQVRIDTSAKSKG